MLLFKYFEKRAKDGLPDPNGPLPARVLLNSSIGRPTERYLRDRGVSAKSAVSEGKKSGPYNR